MLKKTITYENFNEETVSEDFYFHLSKAELVELEMSQEGGLSSWLERVVAAEDGKSIIAEFKKIILSAYGKRSDNGRGFTKNQALRDEFESTEAYSALFMELVTDTDAAITFINGVVPAGLMAEASKLAGTKEAPKIAEVPKLVESEKGEPKLEPKVLYRTDLMKIPQEELAEIGRQIEAGEVVLKD